MAGGRRFHIEPAQVLPDCCVPKQPARADWMARVSFEETRSWAEAAHGWNGDGEATPVIGADETGEA